MEVLIVTEADFGELISTARVFGTKRHEVLQLLGAFFRTHCTLILTNCRSSTYNAQA
jgi:hypothetical protein